MLKKIRIGWANFEKKHEGLAQFLMFFLISNGVTVLQLALMPIFRAIFAKTSLVDTAFQVFHITDNYYIFDYAAGPITSDGHGGGLAYFLAVQITILIAQVINFFMQRSVAFKSNSSVWRAAFWYVVAYIVITIAAGALQGFYKPALYSFFSDTQTVADVITMFINSLVQFWVFFPIFKIIFKRVPVDEAEEVSKEN